MKLKIFLMLGLLILAFGLMTGVAFAQDVPPEAPPTAVEGVQWLAIFLTAVVGLFANRVVEFISGLGFLSGDDKEKLRQPVLDLIAAAGAIGLGYVVAFLTPVAEMFDERGLWAIVIAAWPVVYAWYLAQKATGPKRVVETILELLPETADK